MEVKRTELIVKSNKLIEAPTTLTTFEQRIILYVCSLINPYDSDFQEYEIYVPTFRGLIGISQGYNNQELKGRLAELLKKVVEIRPDDNANHFILTHWLSSADVDASTSTIKVKVDPVLKPYLLQLKGNFTAYQLKQVIRFQNKYSFKIYELLKQHERFKSRTFTLDQLRYYLGIPKEQYQVYKYFKNSILNPVTDEITSKSDIAISYEPITRGRKITGIKFVISAQNRLPEDSSWQTIINLIPEEHRDKQTIMEIIRPFYDEYGADRVIRSIKYANKRCKKNYRRFLYLTLEDDWGLAMAEDEKEALAKTEKKQRDLEVVEHIHQQQKQSEEQMVARVMEVYSSLTDAEKEVIVGQVAKKYPLSNRLSLEMKVCLYYEDHPEKLAEKSL